MASSSANEFAETRLVAKSASHQHEFSLKSNRRFHPWIPAKCTNAKPNISTTTQPSSSNAVTKSSDEQRNTADRIISHSINSIINGR